MAFLGEQAAFEDLGEVADEGGENALLFFEGVTGGASRAETERGKLGTVSG